MPSGTRKATHAGSWYSNDASSLRRELKVYLRKVTELPDLGYKPPVEWCRGIIAPHAGYSYSGPAAAWAYAAIPTDNIQRVFLLGPSHHVYLNKIALTKFKAYGTPLGDIPVDTEVTEDLRRTGGFDVMDADVDEDEHSLEMHLPYIRLMFENHPQVKLVPLLVGSVSPSGMEQYADVLQPYFEDKSSFWIISSDFCHWGTRFSHTPYYPAIPVLANPVPPVTERDQPGASRDLQPSSSLELQTLSRSSRLPVQGAGSTHPEIWESIQYMDHEAIEILRQAGQDPETGKKFRSYLKRTGNTICGRNPISQLLALLANSTGDPATRHDLVFVRYEQSSRCRETRDSSVSYVSAILLEKNDD